jgi:hypothetical protein
MVSGLLMRLWCVSHLALILGDSLMYGDIAKNLLRHGVYGFSQGSTPPGAFGISPTLIRLPGYPLFLAACFRLFGMEHYNAVLYTQAVVDLATCWLAGALAGRLFGSRAALVVLWIGALCPFTASYVATPMAETLVLASIALAFYSFARWQGAGRGYNRWLWIAAAPLAWSILLRPEQVVFAAAVLAAMLWASLAHRASAVRPVGRASPVLVAAFCVILPLVPWTIRNWRTLHVFQPLAPKYANDPGELAPLGFARWYRTWAIGFPSTENVYWNYSGERIELGDIPVRAFDAGSPAASQDLRNRTVALLADYNATTGHSVDVSPAIDARFAALGRERIREHPVLYYVALPVARVLDMTLRPRTEMMDVPLEWWRWSEYRGQTAFAAAYAALNLAYIAVGVAGFFAWRRRAWLSPDPQDTGKRAFRELAFAMAASVVLRAALLLTIDNSEPRYTLEFFPVLFVWAGALFATPSRPPSARAAGDNE